MKIQWLTFSLSKVLPMLSILPWTQVNSVLCESILTTTILLYSNNTNIGSIFFTPQCLFTLLMKILITNKSYPTYHRIKIILTMSKLKDLIKHVIYNKIFNGHPTIFLNRSLEKINLSTI